MFNMCKHHLEGLLKHPLLAPPPVSDLGRWRGQNWPSNKFPSDADADPGTPLWEPLTKSNLHNKNVMILSNENFSELGLIRIHLNLFFL